MKWTFTINKSHRQVIDLKNATDDELIELWVMLLVKLKGEA